MEQDDSQQITNFSNLNVKNIIFSETFNGLYSKYIPIFIDESASSGDEDSDDNVRKLILRTPPQLYMARINEQRHRVNNDVTGYSIKMNLWNRKKGPTQEENDFIKKIEEITEYIKTFLRDIKEELNVTNELIDNFKILNYISEDRPPTLYCKLMTNKSKKIMTSIWNESEMKEMNPYSLIGNKSENDESTDGLVTCALKMENITVTEKRIHVEMKVIEFLSTKIKRPQRKSLLNPNLSLSTRKNFKKNKEYQKSTKPTPPVKKSLTTENIYKVLDVDMDETETTPDIETTPSTETPPSMTLPKVEVSS